MEPAIIAIGTANPQYKQSQVSAVELVSASLSLDRKEARKLKTLYRFTGIDYRHSVLKDACKMPGEFEFFPNDPDVSFPSTAARMAVYRENALPLALAAIEDCFTDCSLAKQAITHVITISCTGMYAPGLDIELVQQLQLNPSTKRTAINFMGCYAAFNGIKVADAICRAEPDALVLVVCVEIGTIHFQKKIDLDNLTSNAIFADGASCALVKNNATEGKRLNLTAFHCDLLPESQGEMAWEIGDSGFDIALSSYVPKAISLGIPNFLDQFIKKQQLTTSDISYYAIHPGAYKILKACENVLAIPADKIKHSYEVLQNFGNMSSATIFFVLKAIWQDLIKQDHKKIIFGCAFGPGLTIESMLLTAQ